MKAKIATAFTQGKTGVAKLLIKPEPVAQLEDQESNYSKLSAVEKLNSSLINFDSKKMSIKRIKKLENLSRGETINSPVNEKGDQRKAESSNMTTNDLQLSKFIILCKQVIRFTYNDSAESKQINMEEVFEKCKAYHSSKPRSEDTDIYKEALTFIHQEYAARLNQQPPGDSTPSSSQLQIKQ